VVIYAGLVYLQNASSSKNYIAGKTVNANDYKNGILKAEYGKVSCSSDYNIDVELFPEEKRISAIEEIIWINKTDLPTKEVLLHLYSNAFKNKHSLYMNEEDIPEESESEINFSEIKIAGKNVALKYICTEIENKYDSTVAKIDLEKEAKPGDTVRINLKYDMPVPKSIGRCGYTENRNFFFLSQWFPKVGVFENGKWTCSQFHANTEFYSDFGEYSVKIKVPASYTVAACGYLFSRKNQPGQKVAYLYKQYGIHDFAFMASDNIIPIERKYKRKDGSEVNILGYIQPESKKYADRYLSAIHNSLEYFEENIGIYPYQNITFIDAPKTSCSEGMEYPTLITVKADMFSPKESNELEELTVHEFAHQYFYGLLANNEVYEAWLDEGFTSYCTSKIIEDYYGEGKAYFNLFKYYPLKGVQFFSYKEIPLVYSLTGYSVPEASKYVTSYYDNIFLGAITDTSYKHFNGESYGAFSYDKPALVLLSMEKFIGRQAMTKILKGYYSDFKYKHPTANDFYNTVSKNYKHDMNWFIPNYIKSSSFFDYEISAIKKLDNANQYEALALRKGEAISRNIVVLYTDKDTLYQVWDGKEKWKKIIFKTQNKVIGAEIDPHRNNLLDVNFANNSYIINNQYSGAVRISLRWFFWMQNLLMIFGGLA
jgi:hypothetical protein